MTLEIHEEPGSNPLTVTIAVTKESTCMELALTETERELLISLLESEVQQIRSEGYHAESHDVKELLKEREAIVNRLLQRLKGV